MSDEVVDLILYGTDREQTFEYTSRAGKTWEYRASFEGVINNLQRRYSETSQRVREGRHREVHVVLVVSRLQRRAAEARSARGDGRRLEHRRARTQMSIEQAEAFFRELKLTERQEQIAHQIVKEIRARLGFLSNVGLELSDALPVRRRRSRAASRSASDSRRRSAAHSSACSTSWTNRRSGSIRATTIVCSRR